MSFPRQIGTARAKRNVGLAGSQLIVSQPLRPLHRPNGGSVRSETPPTGSYVLGS